MPRKTQVQAGRELCSNACPTPMIDVENTIKSRIFRVFLNFESHPEKGLYTVMLSSTGLSSTGISNGSCLGVLALRTISVFFFALWPFCCHRTRDVASSPHSTPATVRPAVTAETVERPSAWVVLAQPDLQWEIQPSTECSLKAKKEQGIDQGVHGAIAQRIRDSACIPASLTCERALRSGGLEGRSAPLRGVRSRATRAKRSRSWSCERSLANV